jgi:hypothetical protein
MPSTSTPRSNLLEVADSAMTAPPQVRFDIKIISQVAFLSTTGQLSLDAATAPSATLRAFFLLAQAEFL